MKTKFLVIVSLLGLAFLTGCPSVLAPRFTDVRQTVRSGDAVVEKAIVTRSGRVIPGSLDKITVVNMAEGSTVRVVRGTTMLVDGLAYGKRVDIYPYSSRPTYDSYDGDPGIFQVEVRKGDKVDLRTQTVEVGTRDPLVATWIVRDRHIEAHNERQYRRYSYFGY